MAASRVEIKVNLKYPVVYPSNIVEGFVSIQVFSDIEFTAVRLKITGKEKVMLTRWVDTGRRDEQNQPIREKEQVYDKNLLFKQLITLAGNMKNSGRDQRMWLPHGTYTYPFAFQLPIDMPPSFSVKNEDKSADVMFYVKAYVDTPNGREAAAKTFFTVLKPMPESQHKEAGAQSADKHFDLTCCCCCSKGSCEARFFIDRTKISMDRDTLSISCEIDNAKGKEKIESVEISLINVMTYNIRTASGPLEQASRTRTGAKTVTQLIEPGNKATVTGAIEIPRNITPTMKSISIKSEYSIVLTLSMPWASNPEHAFPVIIAQAIDETNRSPPCQVNEAACKAVDPARVPEYYYQPPPAPVYAFQPIPTMGSPMNLPPQAMIVYTTLQPGMMPLPPATLGYTAPTAYGQQNYGAQVNWNTGFAQPVQNTGGMPR